MIDGTPKYRMVWTGASFLLIAESLGDDITKDFIF